MNKGHSHQVCTVSVDCGARTASAWCQFCNENREAIENHFSDCKIVCELKSKTSKMNLRQSENISSLL